MRLKKLASKDFSQEEKQSNRTPWCEPSRRKLFVGSHCFWKNRWGTCPCSSKDVKQFAEIPEDEISEVIAETLKPLDRKEGENPATVVSELRTMMQNKVGIIRTKSQLEEALKELMTLKFVQRACIRGEW